jgi:hypothetical protein
MKTLRCLALLAALATSCGGTDAPSVAVAGAVPVPLVDWVTDLVKNPDAPPDTVEDKNVKDTEDPTAFDGLLADR